MPPYSSNPQMNPQMLNRLMLAMYLQQMMDEQSPQTPQRGSGGPNLGTALRLMESFGGGAAGGAAGAGAASGAGAGAVTLGSGGVATIPAGASVPAGYTAVGTAANGGTMVAPTSMAGTTTTAGTSTLGSIGSVALPAAAVVVGLNNMWETGMKDIVRGRGDRADWTNQAVNALPVLGLPGTGGVINLGLRLAGKRSVGQMIESGKSESQRLRDDFRGDLKNLGIADDGYNITLADGSKYNVGLDGGARLKNAGQNIDGKTERQTWDVDWSNPLAKFATDKIEPLIRSTYGADDEKRGYRPGQFTGMLVNAAMSNAKNEQEIQRNIDSILSKFQTGEQQTGQAPQAPTPPARAARGQVARVSPGMYVNDRGQVSRATTSQQAMTQNYGQRQIPRGGKR